MGKIKGVTMPALLIAHRLERETEMSKQALYKL